MHLTAKLQSLEVTSKVIEVYGSCTFLQKVRTFDPNLLIFLLCFNFVSRSVEKISLHQIDTVALVRFVCLSHDNLIKAE